MAKKTVKNWVKRKLEEGVSEERLKKVLRESGRDPSVVDEVNDPFEQSSQQPEDEEDSGEEIEDERIPKISIPDFSIPEIGIPDISDFEAKVEHIAFLLLGLGVIYVGIGAFGQSSMAELTVNEIKDRASDGCPEVGVRINSVSIGDMIRVETDVSGGPASVVLEMRKENKIVEKVYDRFNGVKTIEMTESGSKVVLRPIGCHRIQDSVSLRS